MAHESRPPQPGSGGGRRDSRDRYLPSTPFLLDYDLLFLHTLAWVSAKAEVNGYMAWEKVILGSAFLLPLLDGVSALNANFPAAPFVLIALLWVVARRAWLEPTDLRRRYEERNALA